MNGRAHMHMHMHGTNAIKLLLMLLCSIVDACTKARVTWTANPP